MTELEKYFDAYAEQSLDAADEAALCAWLRQSDAHVEQFARDAFLHWQLAAIGRRRSLQSDVSEAPAGESWHGLRRAVRSEPLASRSHGVRRWWGAVTALAAALAVVASLAAWQMIERSQPSMVAQLTKSAPGLAWARPAAPAAGAFLPEGQVLAIEGGRLLTTLGSGVQIVLEGPAEMRLESSNSVFLAKGRMTVSVPREATGFIVDSPLGQFVDLGTEYTLKLDAAGACQLHVFSGLVELQLAPGVAGEGPLTIPEGRAMRYDSANGKVTILPYDEAERMAL